MAWSEQQYLSDRITNKNNILCKNLHLLNKCNPGWCTKLAQTYWAKNKYGCTEADGYNFRSAK